jgi:hypothetical protein
LESWPATVRCLKKEICTLFETPNVLTLEGQKLRLPLHVLCEAKNNFNINKLRGSDPRGVRGGARGWR